MARINPFALFAIGIMVCLAVVAAANIFAAPATIQQASAGADTALNAAPPGAQEPGADTGLGHTCGAGGGCGCGG